MNILNIVDQIAQEKALSREEVISVLKKSLEDAVIKDYGKSVPVEVKISESDGELKIFVEKKVIPLERFKRNIILTAKQMIGQKVKEIEKEKIYEEYESKIGEIITGSVQKVDRKRIIISLGDAEAIIPLKEQIPNERYRQGDTIKAYILDCSKRDGLTLSRAHPNFLKELFKLEVPEVSSGVIEIKTVARIPGVRAKISVTSTDPKIDPVGACVGMKGSRIKTVVKELNNEKIDCIQWSSDPLVFVSRAITSSKILKEEINTVNKRIMCVISNDDLPQVIGRNGQNVYLASQLTGFKIVILSEDEYKSKGIVFVKEFPKKLKEQLIDNKITTTADIISCGIEELIKIPGIGKSKAEKILEVAKSIR